MPDRLVRRFHHLLLLYLHHPRPLQAAPHSTRAGANTGRPRYLRALLVPYALAGPFPALSRSSPHALSLGSSHALLRFLFSVFPTFFFCSARARLSLCSYSPTATFSPGAHARLGSPHATSWPSPRSGSAFSPFSLRLALPLLSSDSALSALSSSSLRDCTWPSPRSLSLSALPTSPGSALPHRHSLGIASAPESLVRASASTRSWRLLSSGLATAQGRTPSAIRPGPRQSLGRKARPPLRCVGLQLPPLPPSLSLPSLPSCPSLSWRLA